MVPELIGADEIVGEANRVPDPEGACKIVPWLNDGDTIRDPDPSEGVLNAGAEKEGLTDPPPKDGTAALDPDWALASDTDINNANGIANKLSLEFIGFP